MYNQNFKRYEDNDRRNELCTKILENIDILLKEGENEKMLYLIMAYCYKIQKKYEKAVFIYEKYKKYKECGNIYYEKGDYKNSLKYFILSGDDYYVVDCYYKLKEYEDMFIYANSYYKRLKRFTYSKIYQDYSYEYLLSLLPNIKKNKINNNNITLRTKISTFLNNYINIINEFEKIKVNEKKEENINNIKCIYSYIFIYNEKNVIEDLKLNKENDLVSNMINAYYFRLKGGLYKEIVRLIPDIYILKNINLYKNLKFNMKNIERNIINLFHI